MKKTINTSFVKNGAMTLLAAAVLTACASNNTIGNSSIGTMKVIDKRTVKTVMDDGNIQKSIESQLLSDHDFDGSHVVVSSFNHNVLLLGQTPDASLRLKADKYARQVPGVRRIYNEILVSNPTSMVIRSNDTWLTTKIKTEMLATKGLKSGSVKVITENGTVYLLGKVSRDQAKLAVDVTRHVGGVMRVVKVFEYVAPTKVTVAEAQA